MKFPVTVNNTFALARRTALIVLSNRVMFGKTCTSVMLAAALLLGAGRLPAASCILSNAPSEKACAMTCCANKTCCETSHKRTGPPVQPLAKSGADQPSIAPLLSPVAIVFHIPAAESRFVVSRIDRAGHLPAPLALICIRLI